MTSHLFFFFFSRLVILGPLHFQINLKSALLLSNFKKVLLKTYLRLHWIYRQI